MKIIEILKEKIREKSNKFKISYNDLSFENANEKIEESSFQKHKVLVEALREELKLYE